MDRHSTNKEQPTPADQPTVTSAGTPTGGGSGGTGSAQAAPLPALSTALLGRYRLDAELGRGGMGAVYRARDLELERDVAVKVLARSDLDTRGRQRLTREARAAAALNHPNIVTVYDVGQHQGVPFIVMEIVDGSNLRQIDDLALPHIVDVVTQVARALDHIHGHGIVHRDLKPENILIAQSNGERVVKLADLGVALGRPDARLTAEGAIVGTAAYLAPEQALGRDVDARADLYALGVVLYELVTGRLPFTGDDSLAIISQHVHAPVVPPRSFRPDLPARLEAIILRLLAKDPDQRFATARDLTESLERLPEQPETETIEVADSVALLAELVRGRLVARGEELEELRRLWHSAVEGRGHIALISGEPGSGKTRLARELSVFARLGGATVLSGGCYEYEATTPYLPFVEALRKWVHGARQDQLEEALATTAGELAKLAPEITERLGSAHIEASDSADRSTYLGPVEERLRLFDHVARFLQTLSSRQPVLFHIEDLHWADQGTISLLHYLLRQLRSERLLVLATYREVELDRVHPLAAALIDWNRERLASRIQLGRLSFEDASALLATLLNQDSIGEQFARAVYKETEGNPFFVEETVKTLIDQGQIYRERGEWFLRSDRELTIPQSVRAAIGRRLDRLSPICAEMLHTAAALGKSFAFEELLAVAGHGDDELLDALDEATAAQLLANEGDESFTFTHDKIREVLYEELNPIRLRRLHRRIAEGIEKLYAGKLDRYAQDLAHHYLESGDLERGMDFALRAAEQAKQVFAHTEALDFYGRARDCAEELDRPETLVEIHRAIASVLAIDGRHLEAGEHLERALSLAASRDTQLAIKCQLGEAYGHVGDPRGLEYLRVAVEQLDPETQTFELAQATTMIGRYHHYQGDHKRAAEFMEQALALVEPTDHPTMPGTVCAYLAGAYQHLADYEQSNAWARRCIEFGEQRGDLISCAFGYEFLGENATCQGRWRAAIEFAERDEEIAERIHSRDRKAWSEMVRGVALAQLGELREAQAFAQSALAATELIGEKRLAILLGIVLTTVFTDLGDDEAAQETAQRAFERAEASGLMYMRLEARRALGTLHFQRGELEGALARFTEIDEIRVGEEVIRLFAGPPHAEVLVRLGQLDRAAGKIEETLATAETAGATHYQAVTLRVRGMMHAARGSLDEAIADLDRAVTMLDELESRIELGRALVERALVRRRRGDETGARADLERAQDDLERIGARRDATRVAALLRT